jgi:hypothetical protein
VHLAHLWTYGAGASLQPSDFHVGFLFVAVLSLVSIYNFGKLAPSAGADVTGHRVRAPAAQPEEAPAE